MFTSRLLGAACTLFAASFATAQITDGTMTFHVVQGAWIVQNCSFTAEVDDPIGVIHIDGSRVNTRARADGDTCGGRGLAIDTVAGGQIWRQTANAEGYHVCMALHLTQPEGPTGQVDIVQDASISGQARLTNTQAAAAALGYCEASSSAGTFVAAVLTDSVAETVVGAIGDLSQAYCNQSHTANVQLGNGLFADADSGSSSNIMCRNNLLVEHRSCAFIRVLAARDAASPGSARARASMNGRSSTTAWLGVCQ